MNERPRRCSYCGKLVQPDAVGALRGATYTLCGVVCDQAMADDLNTRERDDALYEDYQQAIGGTS